MIQHFASNIKPVSQNLNEYNSNNLEENYEKEKESIDIEFIDQKADPKTMKILLNLNDRMNKKKRKILLSLISLRVYKSKLIKKITNKIIGGLFDDYGIVPDEKKN